jgi:hypothetical protein
VHRGDLRKVTAIRSTQGSRARKILSRMSMEQKLNAAFGEIWNFPISPALPGSRLSRRPE